MSSQKELRWSEPGAPAFAPVRGLAASLLRSVGACLERLAATLTAAPEVASRDLPCLEFHAEAGAPEGALYVDGQLAGWLPGVRRL
jgi:hypothetical protein